MGTAAIRKRSRQPVQSRDNVIGLVHPYRPEYRVTGKVASGTTVFSAIRQACDAAKVRRRLLNYGVAQIGVRDYEQQVTRWESVPFSQWRKRKLKDNEVLRFRVLPRGGGGGGGGKSGINAILSVVVAVAAVAAAVFTAGTLAPALGFAAGGAMAAFMGGVAGLAVTTIGMALVNAIAPVSAPSVSGISARTQNQESDVYSISAGRNSINQWGRVPVPVGRGRFSPGFGASAYTELRGDDQYLHELFCLGIGDMEITDIKIGANPIENFSECQWEIMTYDPAHPRAPKYYPSGVYEETLNIQLKHNQTNIRTTDVCDYAEIDLSFQGLCYLDDQGNPTRHSVCFNIQYKKSDGSAWTDVGRVYDVNGLNWTTDQPGRYMVGVRQGGVFVDSRSEPGADEVRLGYVDVATQTVTWEEQNYLYADTQEGGDGSGGGSGYSLRPLSENDAYYDREYITYTRTEKTFSYTPAYKGNGVSAEGFNVTTTNGVAGSGGADWGYSRNSGGVSVSGGSLVSGGSGGSGINKYCVEGAQTSLLRRTYRINFPSRGVYDVAIARTTEDSDDTRIRDESYWTALRSFSNDLPVKTNYPVMLLSVQIKASGQLSGSIDTLTVFYRTKCGDFDPATGKWIWRYTSNPAAIFRYILQQHNAFSRPQPDELIDFTSLEEAYKYYQQMGFSYDKVMDSSVSLFERLTAICATALSSPTMLEGKWGIVVDKPRQNVICAFTSANAWSWNFARTQIRLPHAIHCNFINENTWDTDMRVVDTDEDRSSGEYLSETQEYDGVVSPSQVYLLARFHYADAKMRRRTISFRAYDEAILCTRGDLVELACPNINVAGLQVGRVRKISYNPDGAVTGFTTDQINTTDFSGRTFGVRIYNDAGQIFHAVVLAENRSQRAIHFETPQHMDIQSGNKYAFGDYSEEVFQAIVLGMKFNTDWTCDITCQDYTPAIYGDLSQPIPEFQSIITRPIEFKWMLYSTPILVDIVSDERALVRGSDGTIICRILAYLTDPTTLDPKAKYYQCEYREVQDDSVPNNIIYSAWIGLGRSVPLEEAQIYISNVNEGRKYQLRFRYAGTAGEVGPWTELIEHIVVGKSSAPPNVEDFLAVIDNPYGVRLSWKMIQFLDIAYYRIGGDAQDTAFSSPVIEQVYRKTGWLNFNIVAVDTGGRTSPVPAQARVWVNPPADPVIESAQLLNAGIVVKWWDSATTWDIDQYEVQAAGLLNYFSALEGVLAFTGKFPKGAYAYMRCKDIFDNWNMNQTQRIITYYPPLTPDFTISLNKLTGAVVLDWQDCTNQDVSDPPEISHYEITGTLANNAPMEVIGTHYESVVPLQIYEYGAGTIEGGIEVNVGTLHIKISAVDKYGIRSEDSPHYKDNSKDLAVLPPYNPTDFGVSATIMGADAEELKANWTEATAVMLTWRDCERTFAIDYYRVYDKYTNTEYKVATNYVVLPARREGSYPLTVQAFDVLGQSSAEMNYNLTIAGVGGMEVRGKVDGSDILLEWDTPPASYQIDHYIIFEDNDDLPDGTNSDLAREGYLGQAKFNYFRSPAKDIGTKIYYVWAVDVAGNINTAFANYVAVTVAENPAPAVTAAVQGNGVQIAWEIASKPADTLPVVAWDVRRYVKLNSTADIATHTPVEDYGRVASDKLNADAFLAGNYSFAVRAIDSGGNEGAWGLCDFNAVGPGQVRFVNQVVIDNNVQLYWSEPNKIFWPIKEYIFDEVDKETGVHMRIGTIDALFASETEEIAGEYTYAITPVDWGGNIGVSNSITLQVAQPPDFIFYDNKDSLFNGVKTNMVLDRLGHMLGPVPAGETWQQNVARATQLAGHAIVTHQGKINAGWPYWLQPELTEGKYVEVTDHGTIIPSTKFKVTVDAAYLSGNPEISCKIEVSLDGVNWRVAAENAMTVYVTEFQYSRVTLTFKDGFVRVDRINIRLDVKRLTDFGQAYCAADDNGDGWISENATPMLTGTWIKFNVAFTDVQSFPRPNVLVTSPVQEGYTAYTVFVDELNPKGFRCFVKDKNGTRVSALVDWNALGV